MSESVLGSESTGQSATTQESGNPSPAKDINSPPASWRDTLPDDIKGNALLGNFSDVTNLAKSYISAQGVIGKKGVIPPTETSSSEEWTNFYKTIGLPEKDKYTVEAPKDSKLDSKFIEALKEASYVNGVLPKQLKSQIEAIEKAQNDLVASSKATSDAASAAQIQALKQEWGAGYDKQVQLAKTAVTQIFSPEFQKLLQNPVFGDNPVIIREMVAMAKKYVTEDKMVGGASGSFNSTPAELRAERDKIMNDLNSPYYNQKHMDHKRVSDRVEELAKALYSKE